MCLPRGMPRWPSIEAVSAVDSPQTKAPAPWLMRMSKSKPDAEDVVAEQAALARLRERVAQALDGEAGTRGARRRSPARAVAAADREGGDEHALDDECGLPSSTERSMNAPGSPSSALQMT